MLLAPFAPCLSDNADRESAATRRLCAATIGRMMRAVRLGARFVVCGRRLHLFIERTKIEEPL